MLQTPDMLEGYMEGQYCLACLHGKGRQLVPVLIPLDCIAAIDLLVDQRVENGVPADNPFVFASWGMHGLDTNSFY